MIRLVRLVLLVSFLATSAQLIVLFALELWSQLPSGGETAGRLLGQVLSVYAPVQALVRKAIPDSWWGEASSLEGVVGVGLAVVIYAVVLGLLVATLVGIRDFVRGVEEEP